MTTYQWSSALNEALYPLGNPPKWSPYPLPMTPVVVAQTDSPLGPGSYLERCEFYMAGSATLDTAAAIAEKFQAESISVIAIGEVYPNTAGGIPDPRTGPDVPAALTAVGTVRSVRGDSGTDSPHGMVWSTDGYVTSHAVRGPGRYGGGTPQLRVAIYTPNLFNGLWIGTANTSEIYHVRALWRI